MASGNPPSYSRPFHPLHSLTVGETHFTFLTRIERTLIWIPYALFIHLLVFIICIPPEQKTIFSLRIYLRLRMCNCVFVAECIFMFM